MTLRYEKECPKGVIDVLEILKEGEASPEELASRIWGEEWEWPLSYQKIIHTRIFHLRKAGVPIGRKTIYYLE